jgi:hypothetical protein
MSAAKVTLSFNSALEFLLLQGANIKTAFLCSFMTPVIINLTPQLSAGTGVYIAEHSVATIARCSLGSGLCVCHFSIYALWLLKK